MGIGSESVFIDTPMEYAFSPVQTAARNEVGSQTISPQNCGGPKSADAAPQERGRQKAAQDAKAAYRRNLAEKRITESPFMPPRSDRGGTMTTPQKGNSRVSAKGSPGPKSRQAMTKAARTMRVRPTDHAAPNNAIITRREMCIRDRVTARQIWGSVRKVFSSTHRWNMPFLRYKPLHEMKSEVRPFLRKIAEVPKAQMPPRRSVGGRKLRRTRKPPIGGTLPKKE